MVLDQAGVPCGKQCKCEGCLNKTPSARPPASAKMSLAAKRFAGGAAWRNPPQQPPQLVIPPLPGTPTALCESAARPRMRSGCVIHDLRVALHPLLHCIMPCIE